MNKKGFIFDLDGVIVDTAKYHFLAWKKLANDLGIDFTEHQNEQLKGVSRVKSLEKILDWGGISLSDEAFQYQMNKKNTDYLSCIETMKENEILVDVPKVLTFLKKEQQPIALGSASKNARKILKKVALYESFDSIVDGTNVSKAKPDPEVFLIAAKDLDMEPNECIVFEDSIAGVQAANKADMISIGIGDQEVLNEANFVFKDFSEVSIEFLKQLINKQ
ncbi:beta-phosphoglucomutase [Tenacibaculum sp. SZ-18]|uniref:beta-phosphoglucomutase n=1 Tax=Tenacibaculum sp. SZ-18 TaxID=754423 RepID=UPI000C2D62B2|nr:beta-phosphoglucomutase [Tenacibaculum sp. SZ-18]AUC14897.1 beta-phosphoglucomutase [Tenacibaculum sp. SZ-18]